MGPPPNIQAWRQMPEKQTEKNGMDALMEYAYFQFYFMEQQIALSKTKLMELSGVK